MRRYHLPIIILGLVSSFVLYLILAQRSPFMIDPETGTIRGIDKQSVFYLATALFLASLSWTTIIYYLLARFFRPQWAPRAQTREGFKFGLLVGVGLILTLVLKLTDTLNLITGPLLWVTVGTLAWTVRK